MQDRDTELALLGSILTDSKVAYWGVCQEGVTNSTFSHTDTVRIWEAMVYCIRVAGSVDRFGLLTRLKREKHIDAMKVVDSIPQSIPAESAVVHAKALRELEKKRKLADLLTRKYEGDIDDSITTLASDAMSILHGSEVHRVKTVSELKEEIMRGVEQAGHGENEFGRLSFISQVNDWAVAYPYGKVTIIGGYRGLGKSSIIKQELLYQARMYGDAGLVSTEDTATDISLSLACLHGAGFMWKYQRGMGDNAKLIERLNDVATLPIHIMDSRQDINQVCENITLLALKCGCKFIVLDYIQDCDDPPTQRFKDENTRFTFFMMALARVAKRLNIALVVCSQFSRDMEKHDKPRPPRLSDLRSSGSLEQIAKRVYLLYKDPDVGHFVLEGAKIGISGKGGEKKAWLKYMDNQDGFTEVTSEPRRPYND